MGRETRDVRLGDRDPSGVDAWRHTQDRLLEFVDDEVGVYCERLAVTVEQIEEMSLPTLRTIVRDGIEENVDHDRLEILREAERSERELSFDMAGHVQRGESFIHRPTVIVGCRRIPCRTLDRCRRHASSLTRTGGCSAQMRTPAHTFAK